MPNKKEARQTWKTGRASVREHDRMISQHEWERGCRMLAGLVLAGWCLVWIMEVCA